MPTVSIDKYKLFEELGEKFTSESFQDLCFEYGIELDQDTENNALRPTNEPSQLKIDIPANRYDMLCFEGIAMALNVFRGKVPPPSFRKNHVSEDQMLTIQVSPGTAKIRPFVAGAVLRGIKFTKNSYDSFIALQEKLHQNLARQRTLVAIGTHDLNTIQGPFTYEALPPKDIKFVPLSQEKSMDGEEIMALYEKGSSLSRYLNIIRDSPVYPVIYDSKRTVCSLPPIINSNHSKITLETIDVFIEMTATDETKLDIVCNIMCAMFAKYCKESFTVEPVKIISEHNGQTRITPSLSTRTMDVEVEYINSCCGLEQSAESLCKLLAKMAYKTEPVHENMISCEVPTTRPDVLHACDVMEDVAVAYGFNRLPRSMPTKSFTVGQPLPINKLSDIVRSECAMAGWVEIMSLVLCSHDENCAWLNRKDDDKSVVKLANPKTKEFQVVRTSLLPGLLKAIRENKSVALPLKIFETSDVVFKDEALERKARNERHWAAAFFGKTSGFELVHGLLDRVMAMLRIEFLTAERRAGESKTNGYWIEDTDDPTFLPCRAAAIIARIGAAKPQRIGEIGVLHPSVLQSFELNYPVSSLELNLETFL